MVELICVAFAKWSRGGKYWLWVNIKSEIACDQIFRTTLPQNHPSFIILGKHAKRLNYLNWLTFISALINTLQTTCHPFFLLSFGMLRNMRQYIRVFTQKHHLGTPGHRTLYNWNWTLKPKAFLLKMKIFFKTEWKGTAQFVTSLYTSWYLFMNGFGWKTCQRHNGPEGWVQLTKVTCVHV